MDQFIFECHQADDEHALKALRDDGFAFACLPTGQVDGPAPDFTMFLPVCGDCRILVVCAPALVDDQAIRLIERLPTRQFDGGTRIELRERFWPACESWLKPSPIILSNELAVANPPIALAGPANQSPWILVADLTIIRAGAEFPLQVVHLGGLAREQSIWRFLVPHGLVPRRVIL